MAKKSKKNNNNFDIKKLMDTSGSYKNLIYGVITVVILFVIIFLGVRTLTQNQGDIDDDAATVDESTEGQQNEYEVAEGDTLWSISEDVYGTGFNWQVIAEANDLANPEDVAAGDVLAIPELTPTESAATDEDAGEEPAEEEVVETDPTATPAPTRAAEDSEDAGEEATATEYTVESGDYLWKIAEEQYGDGYRWVDIARANDLANPNIIHAGNVLVIPR